MKNLTNKLKNYLYFKKQEILERRPHVFDILVGMFLFWALAMLFSSCAVPIPLMLPIVDVPVVIPEKTLI
tara:strand:- start:5173 stop:5382 length:210 start_codon:yes stop_codon:yes gene_type:complete